MSPELRGKLQAAKEVYNFNYVLLQAGKIYMHNSLTEAEYWASLSADFPMYQQPICYATKAGARLKQSELEHRGLLGVEIQSIKDLLDRPTLEVVK